MQAEAEDAEEEGRSQAARTGRPLCRRYRRWDWSCSLSLNMDRQPADPYHEFRHLRVRGRLLHPKGLTTDRIALTFLPSRGLDSGDEEGAAAAARGIARWAR